MDSLSALENIYISPLELCNLHCRYCYTKKTKNTLSNKQILSFIKRYQRYLKNYVPLSSKREVPTKSEQGDLNLKSVLFCGGEVFTLKNFPRLVNNLLSQHIFISVITNGTIDRLENIKDPENCQLLVSFDGPKGIHDRNRGTGNYDKSVKFVAHALRLGFPVEIFFLITKDSYPYKDSFNVLGLKKTYLTDRLGSLAPDQVKDIRQNYRCYPPKNFGCSMLSLQSDGKFYGCCESTKSIGSLSDPLDKIINSYLKITSQNPLCSDPAYFCNLKT